MGEYEPHDSRNVTLRQERAPGEPPRTGPREGETRGETRQPEQTELEQDGRDDAAKRERPVARDGEGDAADESPGG